MRQIIVSKSGEEYTTIQQTLYSIPKDNRECV